MKIFKEAISFLLWLNWFLVDGKHIDELQMRRKYGAVMETLIDPNRYHAYCRPDLEIGKPVEVNITLDVASIEKISDDEMALTVTFTLFQQWRDSRLDATKLLRRYSQVLTMDASSMSRRIWVPDTYIANSQSSIIHDVTTKNGLIRLYPDGTVLYVLRITSQVSCPMDFRNYPMDKQICSFELESWSFPDDQLTYRWQKKERCGRSVTGIDTILLSHFNITKCHVSHATYSSMRGNFSRLSLEFHLKRNLGIFLMLNYIPSACLVILSWISLWISKDAVPARVGLSVTTVLAMTNIMISVYSKGPKSSSYIKAGDIYVCVCNILVFSALVEYAVVHFASRFATKKRSTSSLSCSNDEQTLDQLLSRLTKIFHCDEVQSLNVHPEHQERKSSSQPLTDDTKSQTREADHCSSKRESGAEKLSKIDKYARALYPVTFILFNVIYWWYFLSREESVVSLKSHHDE